MTPAVIYDILRLLLAAGPHTPRGIDRVDLAYAKFLFHSWPGECFGLLPTPWGLRLYERRHVLIVLERIEELWGEGAPAAEDDRLADVYAFFAGHMPSARPIRSASPRTWLRRLTGPMRVLARTGIGPGMSVLEAPQGALYLNVGQLGWAADVMTGWMKRRPDIRAIFLVHDVIPLNHPELVSPSGRWSHTKMLRAVERHATGVICTTEAATTRVAATMLRRTNVNPKIRSLSLPIASAFLQPVPATADHRATHPYFVVYGSIEPRKNHAVLIAAWRKLVRELGTSAPRLIVAGSLGFGGASVLEELLAATELRDHVMVVSGLQTMALRELVTKARAVLMPSWAEGFGLPVMEALTVGTPVIASDLAAHREVGGGHAIYVAPDDADGWASEIAHFVADGPHIAARRAALADYRPMTESSYFTNVHEFLLDVGSAVARP